MKNRLFRLRAQLPTMMLVAGVLLCGEALWIHGKAQVAQVLIARAWDKGLAAPDSPHKPWRWADTWPVLRLQWENSRGKRKDLFVLEGTSGSALAFGPGLMSAARAEYSAMKIIAAHRDTHFAFLENVEAGDTVRIQNRAGKWRDYVVAKMSLVDAGTSALYLDPGLDVLLLITCYPFNALNPGGPLRYVVTAYPVSLWPQVSKSQ